MELTGDIKGYGAGEWKNYSQEVTLALTPESGTKMIRVRFRDSSGFVTDYERIQVELSVSEAKLELEDN